MPRDRGGRTFRVRQIPSNVSKDTLAGLLVNLCQGLGPEQNVRVLYGRKGFGS
jgi:hypothetical protein